MLFPLLRYWLIKWLLSVALSTNLDFRRQSISKRRPYTLPENSSGRELARSKPPICRKTGPQEVADPSVILLSESRVRRTTSCGALRGLDLSPLSSLVSLSCTCAYAGNASQEVVIYDEGKNITIAIELRAQLHQIPLLADCAATL